jgi:hypothetical protein
MHTLYDQEDYSTTTKETSSYTNRQPFSTLQAVELTDRAQACPEEQNKFRSKTRTTHCISIISLASSADTHWGSVGTYPIICWIVLSRDDKLAATGWQRAHRVKKCSLGVCIWSAPLHHCRKVLQRHGSSDICPTTRESLHVHMSQLLTYPTLYKQRMWYTIPHVGCSIHVRLVVLPNALLDTEKHAFSCM